jgi:D-serine deaminase-like pyridoxal phosphate-dependent protein
VSTLFRPRTLWFELLMAADFGAVLLMAAAATLPLAVLPSVAAAKAGAAIGWGDPAAAAARDALRAAGHACAVVTGAGTGTYPLEAATGVYTEVQPGSYVLMDADYFANQPDPQAPALRQALTVHCQVISERPGQVVLDAGLKAFSVDSGLPVPLAEGWRAVSISDEHLVLRPSGEGARATLALGDTLQVVPGHCDPTVNLHDHLVAHRAGRVEAVWPVDARGALT